MTFSGRPAYPSQTGAPDAQARQEAIIRRNISIIGRSSKNHRRHDTRAVVRRPSKILRDLLAQNPNVEHFTVRGIVNSIEHEGPAASLMLFSIPAIVPVPGTSDLVGPPMMAVSSTLLSGRATMRLPASLLERAIPRRALALAIHAVLPVLERAEKMTRKRWSWLCTPSAQRAIGVLVFLLALPLAFPILGFGLPHATSLFTIALGMLERDGATIALGVAAGIASLVFFTAKGLTPKALATKAADWLKRFVRQMTTVRSAALAIMKRTWHWLSVKLLSGPRRTANEAGELRPARAKSAVRRLARAPLTGFANESRLAAIVKVG